METQKAKRRNADQWRKILDDYTASGLTGIEFCKRHNIGLKGFYRAKSVYSKPVEQNGFIKVHSVKSKSTSVDRIIQVTFPHARISIPGDVSAKWVADLLKHTVQ